MPASAAAHGLNSKVVHEQLSLIMGALTRAAVLEICEVVDEGYAVLQLEITRSHQENEDLKKKLHLIESIIVRGGGGGGSAAAGSAADGAAVQAAASSCAEEDAAKGDAEKTLPDVVLIKDEDSDANDSLKDVTEISEDGRVTTHSRNRKRPWPAGSEADGDGRKQSSEPQQQQQQQQQGGHRSPGGASSSRPKAPPQYSLASPGSEPGCSSLSGGGDETACSYAQHPDHMPHQAMGGHYGAHGLDDASLLEGRGELDLSLLWTKQSKLPYAAPFQHHEHYDGSGGGDAFGLKLIGVTGSITNAGDGGGGDGAADGGHLSEGSSSAFDFEDCDGGSFGAYRGGAQLVGGLLPPGARGKRYVCAMCSKTYATSQNLEVHMRIHTGERPFSCPQCGKKFTQSAHLKSHLSVHSGERPFTCALCSKSFIVKYSLKLHMKKYHGTG